MSYAIKQSSTAYPLVFLMVDSADHVSGKTGLSPTVTLSKAGGSFASPSGAVTEIANGFYKVAGNATDSGTLGPLVLHATGTGADPTDVIYEVVAYDPQDSVRLGLTALPNAAAGANGGLPTGNASGQVAVASHATGAIAAASFASGAIDAAAIAADAIGASELAAGAAAEIATAVRSELATELGRVDAAVSTRASQTSVDTIDDFLDTEIAAIKARTDLIPNSPAAVSDIPSASANATAVWGAGTRSLTDKAGFALSTAGDEAVAAAVWDEPIADHDEAGSTGEALAAAGSAGDPWTTALPGSYSSGQAGFIVGTNLDATVSTRATQASVNTIDDFVDTEVAAIKAKTDLIPASPAATGDIPSAATIAAAVWDRLTSALTTVGSIGKLLVDNVNATISSRATQTSVDTVDDFLDTEVAAIKAKTDNLPGSPANEATLTTLAGYVDTEVAAILAAVDTEVAAIKAKTDNLPASPAATGDIPTANANADALLDRTSGIETSLTLRQALRLVVAASAGKLSGAATTTIVIRNYGDSKDRITAVVDEDGNRNAVTYDLT